MVERAAEALARAPHAFSVVELRGEEIRRRGRLLVASVDPADRRFRLDWDTDPPGTITSDGDTVFATRPDGDLLVSSWTRAGSVLFQQEAGALVPAALDPASFANYGGELLAGDGDRTTRLAVPIPGGGGWELEVSASDGLPRRVAFRGGAEAVPDVLELAPIAAEVPNDPAAYRLQPAPGGERVEFFAGPAPGDPAPVVAFRLTDGTTVRLDDLRGSVVALDFWATWCVPCRPAMRELETLHRELGDAGLRVFGLRLWDSGDPTAFLDSLGVTYPLGDGGPLEAPYAVDKYGLPTLYLIGRDGRIVDLLVGFDAEMSPPRLRESVLDALDGA